MHGSGQGWPPRVVSLHSVDVRDAARRRDIAWPTEVLAPTSRHPTATSTFVTSQVIQAGTVHGGVHCTRATPIQTALSES